MLLKIMKRVFIFLLLSLSAVAQISNPSPGGVSTAAGVVALFTSCSGTQYLGADGACHAASGGFAAPGSWSVDSGNWTAGTDNLSIASSRTCGANPCSLFSFSGTATPGPGKDIKFISSSIGATGGANSSTNDTWSMEYFVNSWHLTTAGEGHLTHGLNLVNRTLFTVDSSATADEVMAGYFTTDLTVNGTVTLGGVQDFDIGTISGTGTLALWETVKVGCLPNVSGGMTATAASCLNVGDVSATGNATARAGVSIGGPVSGSDKVALNVTAATPANLTLMARFDSGANVQIKGGLIVSAAVNAVLGEFSGEDANDTFGVVVNGQNSFHYSYDGTGAFEWGVSHAASSDWVLRSPGRSVNNIRINRTTGVLTWNDYKSSSGTRFLCVDSSGVMTASASACSGT